MNVFNIQQIETLPVKAGHIWEATRADPTLSQVCQYTMSGWPSDVPEDLNPCYWRDYELGVEVGCWGPRVVIPKQFDQPLYMYLFLTLCLISLQTFSWHSKASQLIHPYGYCLVC